MAGETFDALLRQYRLDVGLSQNGLARKAGTDPAYINRLERSHHIPSRGIVLSLAKVLGLTPRQTDRFLFVGGHAPVTDWQARAEDYALRLAVIYGALDDLALPDINEPHPFVRRAVG